jgi:nicotinate-nucleotide--dimethylbenzimidazole phosphoribosyltransferase
MNWEELSAHLQNLPTPDPRFAKQMQERLDSLAKPKGSLGRLEEMAVRLAGIAASTQPEMVHKQVVVFCGDHGVTEEGVSAYPSEVTGWMMETFARGQAAINVLARQAGAEVKVVDVGSKADRVPKGVVNARVRPGTANMAQGPAMSRAEAEQALAVGWKQAEAAKEQGVQLLAAGEMGIGNTTAAAAVAAVLTQRDATTLTGMGTGLDDQGVRRKAEVILRSLRINQPDSSDPMDVLAKVGGLEIAAMAGFMLGAAFYRIPVVIDGLISSVAALAAVHMAPQVREILFASHLSVEPAHGIVLDKLGLTPLLDAKMRLGEGSGAVLAFPLMDAALRLSQEMALLSELGVHSQP